MDSLLAWFQGLFATPANGAEAALKVRLTQWSTGTLAALALAVWIAMAEVDRLIADSATSLGRSASASSLQALDPRLGQENWALWRSLPDDIREQVCALLGIYSGLDAVFAILYITLLYKFFASKFLPRLAVGAVAAGELTELILQSQGIAQLASGTVPSFTAAAIVASGAKWLGIGVLVLFVLLSPQLRGSVARRLRRTWQALFFHRISVAVIVLIASLALLPIPGVNDQMPDTQRAWVDPGSGKFLVTSLAALLVSAGLFYLGRRRSELAWSLYFAGPNVPDQPPKYWMWACPPLLLGLAIAFVAGTTGLVVPQGWQTLLAAGLPLFVAALSWCLATWGGPGTPVVPKPVNPVRAADAWRCGDVLAIVLLVVSGTALVRAFTAPLALIAAGALELDGTLGASIGYFIVGLAIVGFAFPTGALVVRILWGKGLNPRVIAGPATQLVTVVLVLAFAAMGFAFAVNPVGASSFAGVPGTALLTVGSWAMVIGLSVVALQRQQPLRLFRRMGLRANPVITLLAVVLAVGSLNGGNPLLHHVREVGVPADIAAGLAARPDVATAFGDWLKRSAGCGVAGPAGGAGGHLVRPMILVAAEGGGIRAASWTTRALEKLAAAGGCGGKSVMLSSGVSGGSLGLTLSRLYGPESVKTMELVAKPGPLEAAVAGAIAGDVVGSGTGLMIPTKFTDPATDKELLAWNDRASLVESLWEQSAGSMAGPFEATVAGPTGALLLNSTDAGTGCRVIVSQLDLPGSGPGQPDVPANGVSCRSADGVPASVDLFDQQSQCPLFLRWSTATLLSGRFPIISPAGRAPAMAANAAGSPQCQINTAFQLIDGGYAEGSALGTINDLWPALRGEVLRHNSCVLAAAALPSLPAGGPCAGTDAKGDIVVPVFLFLQNSPGADIVGRPPKAAGELAVPLVGLKAAKLQSGSAAWIQRLEEGANVCPLNDPGSVCMEAAAGMKKVLGNHSVVVVAPNSVPALAAPLGWSLSGMSQKQLAQAMDAEALIKPDGCGMQDFAKLLRYLAKGTGQAACVTEPAN